MTQPTVVSEFETEVVVSRVSRPAEDVVELTMTSGDGRPLPPWTPGAHVDLFLDGGLLRQYSLCSSPGDPTCYQVAVLLTPDSRGGSRAVHQLAEGTRIRIRGPRNNFPLVSSRRYLFIAGGIGITPIHCMIEKLQALGQNVVDRVLVGLQQGGNLQRRMSPQGGDVLTSLAGMIKRLRSLLAQPFHNGNARMAQDHQRIMGVAHDPGQFTLQDLVQNIDDFCIVHKILYRR